jgi:hypothetical protein
MLDRSFFIALSSAQRRHAHGHHQHSVFREEFENVVSARRI